MFYPCSRAYNKPLAYFTSILPYLHILFKSFDFHLIVYHLYLHNFSPSSSGPPVPPTRAPSSPDAHFAVRHAVHRSAAPLLSLYPLYHRNPAPNIQVAILLSLPLEYSAVRQPPLIASFSCQRHPYSSSASFIIRPNTLDLHFILRHHPPIPLLLLLLFSCSARANVDICMAPACTTPPQHRHVTTREPHQLQLTNIILPIVLITVLVISITLRPT